MPQTRPTTLLPFPAMTASGRTALTLFAAQAMHHPDTVCPARSCRRHRCCIYDDTRTGELLCVLRLDEDERRAFDAALALAEHLCLHFIPGDLGGWYRRRLAAGATPPDARAAVAIVASVLPKSDGAVAEFRAFLRDKAVTRAVEAQQCRSGTESGNGTGGGKICNHSSSV